MRLHPLSAVGRAFGGASAGAGAGFGLGITAAGAGLPGWTIAALAALGALAGAAAGVARYLAFDYELSGDRLVVRSGVVRRREREIPLGRVQTVDVSRSVTARVLGLAAVRIETAGGGATEAALSWVSEAEARRLQDALRAPAEAEEAGPEGRPGEVLFRLPDRALPVLALASFQWRAAPAALLAAPLLGSFLPGLASGSPALGWWVAAAVAATLLGVAGVLALLFASVLASGALAAVRYYGFVLRRVGDELRYERGLLQRYSGTIPLEKVQTLTVEENLAMRRLGYAALTVETAGYAPGERSEGQRAPSAVPLAGRERVLELVDALAGVEDLSVEPPPERARSRYAVRYGLAVVAVTGVLLAARLLVGAPRAWFVPLVALALAPAAARLKWRHRGHRVDDGQFLARTGFWRRATRVVPHYRLQTVLERRTVFQRRWGLASVTADTASTASLLGGDATAHDVDADDAGDLHRTLRERLRASLRRRRGRREDREPDG